MDKTDLQILSILRENARTPLKAIAEKVFLSSPATAARIERLEKAGIIPILPQFFGFHYPFSRNTILVAIPPFPCFFRLKLMQCS